MPDQMNILLVEDNAIDAMFVTRAMAKVTSNGQIVHAKDGQEALEMLTHQNDGTQLPRPFFILLDINMPRMNGHEFLQVMRGVDGISDNIVFMFTTSDNPQDISKAYKNRANGYIVKPEDLHGLKNVLSVLQDYWHLCEVPDGAVSDLKETCSAAQAKG